MQPYAVRPPTPAIAIAARVVAFVTLTLVVVWGLFLAGVSSLTIMWGPPCTVGRSCESTFWSAVGVGFAGCAATCVILLFALPMAWRRPSLIVWTLVALGIAICTAVWALSNARL